jgi:hypothetical protein
VQIGEPIGEGWAIYKRFWRHLLPIAFVVSLVVSAISLVLTAAGGWFAVLAAVIVSTVGVFLIQAALTEAVADVRDGRADLTLGATLGRAWPRVGTVVAVSIVAGIAIAIGFVLIIVPGLYLMTIWSVVVPAVVLEKLGVFDALGRSRALVKGYGWTVFGVIVVTFLIDVAASIVLGIVLVGLPDAPAHYFGNVITTTLVTPFVAATWTCMYFRLRELQEPQQQIPAGAAYVE